jgi:anti-anti-sigma factor
MAEQMQTDVVVTDGTARVVVAGEIDLATSHDLNQAIKQALRAARDMVSIDLSAVTFCDSSGLAVFAVSERECALAGVQFRITGANGAVRKVFNITGLDELLDGNGTDARAVTDG